VEQEGMEKFLIPNLFWRNSFENERKGSTEI